MNIVSTQYTLATKTLEIYVSGCDGICGSQCHNYELRDFNLGECYLKALPKILSKVECSGSMIDNIWVLGGEPMLQNLDELKDFVKKIKTTNKKLWLFTRFEYDEVIERFSDYNMFDYIKCGKYDVSCKTNDNIQHGIKLATSNQYIVKL